MRWSTTAAALTIATAGACSTAGSGAASAGRGATTVGEMHWVGSLVPTQERTGDLRPAGQTRMYGTVTMSPAESGHATRIELSVNMPTTNRSLAWALLPDRCGSGTLPVVPVNAFPTLEISGSGRAQVQAEIPYAFPTTGAYHLNVYGSERQGLSDVVGCTNLSLKRG